MGSETDFVGYLNPKLDSLLGSKKAKDKVKVVKLVLKRIQDHGNHTKHDDIAASFNGNQLANDFETLNILISSCLDTISKG